MGSNTQRRTHATRNTQYVTPSLESKWVTVGGRRMHARVSEGGGLPPVVLVHGLGVSSRYMVPTALRMAPYCSVYAVDLPGFGKSAHPPHALDVPRMADALDAWMAAVGLAGAAFIGNSMGCQAIVDLAVRYPHRVERAVLVGPTFDRKSRASLVVLLLRVLRDGRWEPKLLSPIVIYDYLSAGLIRIAITLRYGLRDRIEEKLPLVKAPMLVVRGEHDAVVPLNWARQVARLLPSGRLVVIRGASHAINFSAPEKLARVALGFFAIP
ncbi:MAG: alpha/beta fold hydrolase, partial [Chloroflexia bacterium]